MSLDLLPRPMLFNSTIPDDMVHLESEPCPFKDDSRPNWELITCCSFPAAEVAFFLHALGLTPLFLSLYEDKTPEQALKFAETLRVPVLAYRERIEGIAGRGAERSESSEIGMVPGIKAEFSVDEALRAVEAVASWYEKKRQNELRRLRFVVAARNQ